LIAAVLALQGDFDSHLKALRRHFSIRDIVLIKKTNDIKRIDNLDILAIPGGESSTFSYLLEYNNMIDDLVDLIKNRTKVVLGTCAGAILLAKNVVNKGRSNNLGIVDITIQRNAYGRQVDSFIGNLRLSELAGKYEIDISNIDSSKLEAVFIRAPKIIDVGSNVEILGYVDNDPVFVRENNIILTTFHPELSNNSVVYDIIRQIALTSTEINFT